MLQFIEFVMMSLKSTPLKQSHFSLSTPSASNVTLVLYKWMILSKQVTRV
ncbi:hypothetical protein W04_1173 [Pseudoalteromonas sp. SW0106-04]|nr:hypothetical protein W04_1173 [Pseudoalteromonas sp. SW0106-04]